jgi:hypothetical protein
MISTTYKTAPEVKGEQKDPNMHPIGTRFTLIFCTRIQFMLVLLVLGGRIITNAWG